MKSILIAFLTLMPQSNILKSPSYYEKLHLHHSHQDPDPEPNIRGSGSEFVSGYPSIRVFNTYPDIRIIRILHGKKRMGAVTILRLSRRNSTENNTDS